MIRGILGAALLFSLTLPAQAANSAGDWLSKMSRSHRELSYRAVVTHQLDEQMASYRLTHVIADGREFEFLEPLDSGSAGLSRRGHSINCVHPAEQMVRAGSGGNGLARFYDLAVSGTGRVAGRDAVIVHITPRDVYRLGYQLALDRASGLPLRSEIRGAQGKVLERFQVVTMDIGAVGDVKVPAGGREVSHSHPLSVEESGGLLQRLSWRPEWLPAGFVLAQTGDQSQSDNALSFTDGLAMFTVFVEPAQGKAVKESAMRHGASLMYRQQLPGKPFVATVVGEIPVLTARQVAKSIRWQQ